MSTTSPPRGRAYWTSLGIRLPEYLTDHDADSVMDMILTLITISREQKLKLIASLGEMSPNMIAQLKAVARFERDRILSAWRARPAAVAQDLAATAFDSGNSGVQAIAAGEPAAAALHFDATLAMLALEPLVGDLQFDSDRQ